MHEVMPRLAVPVGMAVPVCVTVAVGSPFRAAARSALLGARPRLTADLLLVAHREQAVEQAEAGLGSVAREADEGRVLPGPPFQPKRRPKPMPADSYPGPNPRETAAQRAAVECGEVRPNEADVASLLRNRPARCGYRRFAPRRGGAAGDRRSSPGRSSSAGTRRSPRRRSPVRRRTSPSPGSRPARRCRRPAPATSCEPGSSRSDSIRSGAMVVAVPATSEPPALARPVPRPPQLRVAPRSASCLATRMFRTVVIAASAATTAVTPATCSGGSAPGRRRRHREQPCLLRRSTAGR